MKYYLIDYENVQPKNVDCFDSLNPGKKQVYVFIGAKQVNINVKLVIFLNEEKNGEYIQVEPGKNSLDFHVAYVMGELAQSDPEAEFVIISKDTGYDPLITYINEKKEIPCCRREEL